MRSDITIIRPKTRDEWLEVRKGGIGSSEVASIVGLNPYETALQVWSRKMGLTPPKAETPAMKAGHYLEDAVSMFAADATGREIIKSSKGDWIVRDNAKPFLQVSPDRTYWLPGEKHNDENKGILECKTTQMDISTDNIPMHWFCQLQYQLGVSRLSHGTLAWLSRGRDFGYKDIDLVPDFYAWLVGEIERFWVDNIEGNKMPSAVNAADALLAYSNSTKDKYVEVDDDIFAAYQKAKEIRAQIKGLEVQQAAAEDIIKMAFGDAEGITYNATTIATWKTSKPSVRLDAKALQAAHPDTYAQFLVQQPGTRRFLLK